MTRFVEKRFLPKRSASPAERERITREIAGRLGQEPDVLFAYVHGSFLSGEGFRDIDIALFTRVDKDLSFESDLSFELSRALGQEVEVRIINDAPVAFQMAVLRNGRLLFCRDEEARTQFIVNVGRRYREYAHFRNVFMEAVRGQD